MTCTAIPCVLHPPSQPATLVTPGGLVDALGALAAGGALDLGGKEHVMGQGDLCITKDELSITNGKILLQGSSQVRSSQTARYITNVKISQTAHQSGTFKPQLQAPSTKP